MNDNLKNILSKNYIRIINKKYNTLLGAGIDSIHHSNDNVVVSKKDTYSSNTEWLAYPVNDSHYIFVNMQIGYVMTCLNNPIFGPLGYIYLLKEEQLTPLTMPLVPWIIENTNTPNTYRIRFSDKPYLLQGMETENTIMSLANVTTENEEDPLYCWEFEISRPIKQTINLTLQTLDPAPEITKPDQVLTENTEEKLIGFTKIPALFINDDNKDLLTKITNSPYYFLKKIQNWQRKSSFSVLPNNSIQDKIEYSISQEHSTNIETDTGIRITQDSGMNFGFSKYFSLNGSYQLQNTIINDLQTHSSQTNQKIQRIEKDHEIDNQSKNTIYIRRYALQTKFELKRQDDAYVNDWIFEDPNILYTTMYPPIIEN